jgi:hypothetical protein
VLSNEAIRPTSWARLAHALASCVMALSHAAIRDADSDPASSAAAGLRLGFGGCDSVGSGTPGSDPSGLTAASLPAASAALASKLSSEPWVAGG